jgi:hypothetical protein
VGGQRERNFLPTLFRVLVLVSLFASFFFFCSFGKSQEENRHIRMSVPLSPAPAGLLLSLAVYSPLLCQDREESAQDNILFFFPPHTNVNKQMNQVGFCIAMSSLAPRFGIQHSNRQTICKQRSSVCLYSPVADLWASAHVRGGYGEAEATHRLLQLSFALFELLYSRDVLQLLTELPVLRDAAGAAEAVEGGSSDGEASPAAPHANRIAEARTVLQSYFTKCATFFADVLAAQQKARAHGVTAQPPRPFTTVTSTQWARYFCEEAIMGFPLHYVDASLLPPQQLGSVDEAVQRVLWSRAWSQTDALHEPGELPRCCVFCLPSLYLLIADSRLPCRVLQAIKYYLLLYAPMSSSSFTCHLPDEGWCDVAVWEEDSILVVLLEAPKEPSMSSVAHPTPRPTGSTNDTDNSAEPFTSAVPSTSLLECASAVGAAVHQRMLQSRMGLTASAERDAYWLSTNDMVRHAAHYTVASLSKASAAVTSTPISAQLRFVGGTVEGTSLLTLWPGLMEHVRAVIHSVRLTIAASPSADAEWECWTRWGTVWVHVHFIGPTVTILAWRSPVNFRRLFLDAKRITMLSW